MCIFQMLLKNVVLFYCNTMLKFYNKFKFLTHNFVSSFSIMFWYIICCILFWSSWSFTWIYVKQQLVRILYWNFLVKFTSLVLHNSHFLCKSKLKLMYDVSEVIIFDEKKQQVQLINYAERKISFLSKKTEKNSLLALYTRNFLKPIFG